MTKRKAKTTESKAAAPRQKICPESTMAILSRLLLTPVASTANGKKSLVPPLEAITSQLLRKALEGDARAVRALERYKQLASQNTAGGVTVEFAVRETSGHLNGERNV